AGRMRAQTEAAIRSADVSLFMIDARAGLTPLDRHFAELLRAAGKPVVIVANKAEGAEGRAGALEAYGLGFGDPVAISAEHGEGLAGLYDELAPLLGQPAAEEQAKGDGEAAPAGEVGPLRVAIVGRPNAGKS